MLTLTRLVLLLPWIGIDMGVDIHDYLDDFAQRQLREKYETDEWFDIDKIEFTIAEDDNLAVLLISATVERDDDDGPHARWVEVDVDGYELSEVLSMIGYER